MGGFRGGRAVFWVFDHTIIYPGTGPGFVTKLLTCSFNAKLLANSSNTTQVCKCRAQHVTLSVNIVYIINIELIETLLLAGCTTGPVQEKGVPNTRVCWEVSHFIMYISCCIGGELELSEMMIKTCYLGVLDWIVVYWIVLCCLVIYSDNESHVDESLDEIPHTIPGQKKCPRRRKIKHRTRSTNLRAPYIRARFV